MNKLPTYQTICSNSPALNGRLPFWEESFHPPDLSWILPFWDNPDLNVRYLWNFQVDHTFYKVNVKILTTINDMRYVRCYYPPSSSSALDPCQQNTYSFSIRERSVRNESENQYNLQFLNHEKCISIKWSTIEILIVNVRWIFKKVLAETMQNSTF